MGRPKKVKIDNAVEESVTVDFSILLPSRDRVDLLKKLLDSVITTTSDIKRVEVLIAVDSDDTSTRDFLEGYCNSSVFVKFFVVSRSVNFSRDYYNYLYGYSTGRWVIALNDDAEFMTVGWDVSARRVLGSRDVIYGSIEDNLGASLGGVKYSCWPLIGRRGIEALGYFFPTRIPCWGADIWAAKLYGRVEQVLEMPFRINHVCHHNGTRERDALNERVGNISGTYSVEPTNDEVSILNNILTEVMA